MEGVLARIRRLRSPTSKRVHYEALIESGRLDPVETEKLVRQAGRDLGSSSTDLAAVLGKLQASARRSVGTRKAIGDVIGQISSSGDRASVLSTYAQAGDSTAILMALEGAKRLSSDTDRLGLLEKVAPYALKGSSPRLRTAFWDAYSSFSSDTDRLSLLLKVLIYAKNQPALVAETLRASHAMTSDTDRATILIAVANQGLLTTAPLRTAYMTAARHMTSDTDYRNVLEALLKR